MPPHLSEGLRIKIGATWWWRMKVMLDPQLEVVRQASARPCGVHMRTLESVQNSLN